MMSLPSQLRPYRINYCLRTETPLHIGSGNNTDDKRLVRPNKQGGPETVQVAQVALDYANRPYIPGTAIKGCLHQWTYSLLRQHEQDGEMAHERAMVNAIFGIESQPSSNTDINSAPGGIAGDNNQGIGGKVEFHSAYLSGHDLEDVELWAPYWDNEHMVATTSAVGINRHTRTAHRHHLFHQQIVPPGVTFKGELNAPALTEEELAILFNILDGFNRTIRLGADTANAFGKVTCDRQKVAVWTTPDSLAEWLNRPFEKVGYEVVDTSLHTERIIDVPWLSTPESSCVLTLDLSLSFSGPFLVNDPSRMQENGKKNDAPDHYPRVNHERKPVLPARSFRGAFRSQVERIARTLNAQASGNPHRHEGNDLDALGEIARVFGTTGLRTAIQIDDFVGTTPLPSLLPRQEFVAVDRFTGGSAEGAKFNADYADRPTLEGRIAIDLQRTQPWMLGLLALAFKDLMDGDITFGWGASKGYGVIGSVSVISHHYAANHWPCTYTELPGLKDVSPAEFNSQSTDQLVNHQSVRQALDAMVSQLRDPTHMNQLGKTRPWNEQ